MAEQIKKLLVNTPQEFTESEKAQGRANLGCAAATDFPTDVVKYTPQTLTNIEKAQARQNINAATGDVATTLSTSSVTNCNDAFCYTPNVESGALAFYNQVTNQANPPTDHENTFLECGINTVTGAAELAQIPTSWGGTGT